MSFCGVCVCVYVHVCEGVHMYMYETKDMCETKDNLKCFS